MKRELNALGLLLLCPVLSMGQPRQLQRAWEYETPGLYPQSVVSHRDRPFLFAALKNGGLGVLETKDATSAPRSVATLPVGKLGGLDVMHLTLAGDVLYLALGDFFAAGGSRAGLAAVSIKDPRSPRLLSSWISPGKLRGAATVVVDRRHAYLGAMTEGVMIFDIAQPEKIRHLTTFQPDVQFPRANPNRVQHPNARGLALVGQHLFVAYDAGGLRVLDVSNPLKTREVGRYINASMIKKQQAYNNVVVDGDLAYVAVDYAGLEILDVRNVKAIRQVGWWNPWRADTLKNLWFNSPGHTNQIELDRARKLVYLSAGDAELQVVTVADPRRLELVAEHGGARDDRGVWGVTLAEKMVYLTYIPAVVPFRGKWAGIVALER